MAIVASLMPAGAVETRTAVILTDQRSEDVLGVPQGPEWRQFHATLIERLNRAGLDHMQISIDNVQPDDVSKKSLKVLDQKLRLLAEYAEFPVVINSVLGSGVRNPEDALTVAHRAIELGFLN